MREATVRVLVVDDDAGVRAALREVLDHHADLEWIGDADDAASAVAACESLGPDVVLMDVRIPGGGIAATADIAVRCPSVSVVALTSYSDRLHREQMAAAGAARYVTKGAPTTELLAAIRGSVPTA